MDLVEDRLRVVKLGVRVVQVVRGVAVGGGEVVRVVVVVVVMEVQGLGVGDHNLKLMLVLVVVVLVGRGILVVLHRSLLSFPPDLRSRLVSLSSSSRSLPALPTLARSLSLPPHCGPSVRSSAAASLSSIIPVVLSFRFTSFVRIPGVYIYV